MQIGHRKIIRMEIAISCWLFCVMTFSDCKKQSSINASGSSTIAAAVSNPTPPQQSKHIPPSDGRHFELVQFLDQERGWGITPHILWKTVDGGLTWRILKEAYRPRFRVQIEGAPEAKSEQGPPLFLGNFYFTNEQSGWLIEDNELQYTTDGGSTWQKCMFKHLIIYGVRFADEKNGWFVGQRLQLPKQRGQVESFHPVIYKTANAGRSWRNVFTGPDDHYPLYDIWPLTEHNIWAVGCFILHSIDGGRKWQSVHIANWGDASGMPGRISFVSPKAGWMETSEVGYLITTDGGTNWEGVRELPQSLSVSK